LQATLQQLGSYQLRTVEQLEQFQRQLGKSCQALPGLASYPGFQCLQHWCGFQTRHISAIKKHVAAIHQVRAASHCTRQPLWRACQLQTYFTANGRISYFVVVVAATGTATGTAIGTATGTATGVGTGIEATEAVEAVAAEQALFTSLEHDASAV
jgi:Orsellinic acid/F9775 biosynthesis cluster protein D